MISLTSWSVIPWKSMRSGHAFMRFSTRSLCASSNCWRSSSLIYVEVKSVSWAWSIIYFSAQIFCCFLIPSMTVLKGNSLNLCCPINLTPRNLPATSYFNSLEMALSSSFSLTWLPFLSVLTIMGVESFGGGNLDRVGLLPRSPFCPLLRVR